MTLVVLLGWCLLSLLSGVAFGITLGHLQASSTTRTSLTPIRTGGRTTITPIRTSVRVRSGR